MDFGRVAERLAERRMRMDRLGHVAAEQPISMAKTASLIRSPAPEPTMPQPTTRCVGGSMIHLVSPSVRPMAWARPLAIQGNWATSTVRPWRLASVSVSPAQAISGSVKTTAGIAFGSNATCLPSDHLDGRLAFVGRLVGQHRLAGHVADGQNVRIGRAALRDRPTMNPRAST